MNKDIRIVVFFIDINYKKENTNSLIKFDFINY
jgi:hypothetical protein